MQKRDLCWAAGCVVLLVAGFFAGKQVEAGKLQTFRENAVAFMLFQEDACLFRRHIELGREKNPLGFRSQWNQWADQNVGLLVKIKDFEFGGKKLSSPGLNKEIEAISNEIKIANEKFGVAGNLRKAED